MTNSVTDAIRAHIANFRAWAHLVLLAYLMFTLPFNIGSSQIQSTAGDEITNVKLSRLGLRSTFLGYAVFAAGAVLGFHALRLFGDTSISAFIAMPMVHYWASFSPAAAIVTTVAAAAGVTIIPTHRSVLTAGVMVALALVPGAAILGISLSIGLWEFAVRGLLQWLLNASAVVATGVIIFALKNRYVHRRYAWH